MLLAAAEVPNFLAGLLPSTMTIRTFAADPEQVRSLRRSELIGAALAAAVGVGASLVARSLWPALATALVLAVLLREYEAAIRNPIERPLDMRRGPRRAEAE